MQKASLNSDSSRSLPAHVVVKPLVSDPQCYTQVKSARKATKRRQNAGFMANYSDARALHLYYLVAELKYLMPMSVRKKMGHAV